MLLSRCGVLAILLLAASSPVVAVETAAELVRKLPGTANAITIVRVSDILQTAKAKQDNIAQRELDRYLQGQATIPPWVQLYVSGALVRPSVPRADWTAALAVVPPDIRLETLSGMTDAEIEYVERVRAAESARDGLFLELQPGLLGIMSPAYRQDAGQWCRELAAATPSPLSPYLLKAADNPAHVVLAMDLRDLPNPRLVRRRLSNDESLADQATARVKVATDLIGIQGGLLAITFTDVASCEVRFDFKADVSGTEGPLHRAFLGVLDDIGIGIEEFETAQVSTAGTAFMLKTNLSDASLRRIMSLVITPHPEPHEVVEHDGLAVGSDGKLLPQVSVGAVPTRPRQVTPQQATEHYISTINEILDDLHASSQRAKDYRRTATWHENFARKIANLSTRGVDPAAVSYGESVASKLRGLAASLRGQGVRISANQKSLTYEYDYNPGGVQPIAWGVFGPVTPHVTITDSNLQEVRQRQSEAIIAGADQRIALWQAIGDERAALDATMRKRFGDDFGRKK